MKKTMTIVLSVALVAAIAITGTLAYLTAGTKSLNNQFTFSMNGITLELTEPEWDKNLGDNTKMKVVPGITIDKDPTVKVKAEDDAYVYVLVNNQIADKVVIGTDEEFDRATDIGAKWVFVQNIAGKGDLYRYKANAVAEGDQQFRVELKNNEWVTLDKVFTKVTVKAGLEGHGDVFGEQGIVIDAYAHQFAQQTSVEADKAAVAHFQSSDNI